jgi:hypothetical protein
MSTWVEASLLVCRFLRLSLMESPVTLSLHSHLWGIPSRRRPKLQNPGWRPVAGAGCFAYQKAEHRPFLFYLKDMPHKVIHALKVSLRYRFPTHTHIEEAHLPEHQRCRFYRFVNYIPCLSFLILVAMLQIYCCPE